MVEPFSIISAAAGLFDVSVRTSTTIHSICKDIKNGPALLAALSNEIVDLGVVLNTIVHAKRTEAEKGGGVVEEVGFAAAVDAQLGRGKTILKDLTRMIDELNAKNTTIQRVQFALKKNRAAALKDQLRDVRGQLNDILMAHNVSISRKILLKLSSVNITVEAKPTSTEQSGLNESQRDELSLTAIPPTYQQSTSSQQQAERSTRPATPLSNIAAEVVDHPNIMAAVPTMSAKSPFTGELQLAESLQQKVQGVRTVSSAVDTMMDRLTHQDPSLLPSFLSRLEGMNQNDLVDFGLKYQHFQCPPDFITAFQHAYSFSQRVGSLFVGYNGYPVNSTRCSSKQCARAQATSLQVHYVFPSWFLKAAIRASMQTSAIGGITLGIVVKQRIEFTPSIISATQRGSIKELRSFFVSESLRIDHVDDINGRSALHYAMYNITIDIDRVRMLLQYFLPFHHAIGFNRIPVAARMIEMGVDIESRTTNAQETALEIAARRNLVGLVEYLCDQGADLNALDRWGWTPLLRAIESKAHDTLKILLDRGADQTRRTPTDATILHIAAIRGNVETFDILASSSLNGVNVEAKDQKDHTATYYFEDENTNLDNPEAEPAFRRLLRAVEHTMAETVPSAQDHEESDGEADCHFVDA
ncbi:hypothetical protein LTS18_004691 [Coniosporium uncinatum]|uniref:Uncharacterized protein n=1 Tax=Coniosporium uncinatum TaxID=93489 RepID=A0ACC3DS28_9PEZI|nr:hypothetical protein LTS18_004691 [Coniosporium uncinatum]